MSKRLPKNPSLSLLKDEAKLLQKHIKSSKKDACQRIIDHHHKYLSFKPEELAGGKIKLSEAQYCVAKEYGFESWNKLNKHIQTLQKENKNEESSLNNELITATYEGRMNDVCRILDQEQQLVNCTGQCQYWDGECTPLMAAALTNQIEIALLLIEKGSNIDWPVDDTNSPLNLALSSSFSEFANLLLKNGAELNIFSAVALPDTSALKSILAEKPQEARRKTSEGVTPLHNAATVEAIQLLMKNGAELEVKDTYHQATPLKWIMHRNNTEELVAELRRKGAKLDVWDYLKLGDYKKAKELINHKPNLVHQLSSENDIYIFGGSLLHLAASSGAVEMGEFLLQKGADINCIDQGNFKATPLHWAAFKNQAEFVKLLLNQNADREICDAQYRGNPESWASFSGHQKIVDLFK